MYCENCGTSVEAGSKFCSACGNKIEAEVGSPRASRSNSAGGRKRNSSYKVQTILLISIPALLLVVVAVWLIPSAFQSTTVRRQPEQSAPKVDSRVVPAEARSDKVDRSVEGRVNENSQFEKKPSVGEDERKQQALLASVVFSVVVCDKVISYRHVRGDVPPQIDLSVDETTKAILAQAAQFAQANCPKDPDKPPPQANMHPRDWLHGEQWRRKWFQTNFPNLVGRSLANIEVNLYQGDKDYKVHARNYETYQLDWREYTNKPLNARLKVAAKKRDAEERQRRDAEITAQRQKDDVDKAQFLAWLRGQSQAAGATKPDQVATIFLRAAIKRDFNTIFSLMSIHQNAVASIKSADPKEFWDQKIGDYYIQARRDFYSNSRFTELRALTPPDTQIKLLEMRKQQGLTETWISLDYPSQARAPITFSNGSLRTLKRSVYKILIDNASGQVGGLDTYPDGFSVWPTELFRIVMVVWQADSLGGLNLQIAAAGGTPPYNTITTCGSWVLENIKGATRLAPAGGAYIGGIRLRAKLPDEAFPLRCTAQVTDKLNAVTAGTFTVPQMFTGMIGSCWVYPWYRDVSGGCSTVQELETGRPTPPPEKYETVEQGREAGRKPASSAPLASSSNVRSLESRIRSEVIFENRLREPVLVFWVNFQGQEVLFKELNPRESHSIQSFVTHPWRVRTKRARQPVKEMVANSQREVVIIQ